MGPFVGILDVFDGLEERPQNCALLICIKVPWSSLHLSVGVTISLGVQLWVVLLLVLIRDGLGLLEPRSWLKHLILSVSFPKGLVFKLK